MAKMAFLFPGQGSQSVGMGKDLYENYPAARRVMDQFNQWVSPDLTQVMFEGPEDTLRRTLYTQPAILSVSLAALTAFREKIGCPPDMAAGHSLGEYTALYAADVVDLETAARLIQKRADLMENAPAGAMAAILGLPEAQVEDIVRHVQNLGQGMVTVANYNTPEQLIISGENAAVEAACALAKEQGAMKIMRLPVGGAFHSPLMQTARDTFRQVVMGFSFRDAQFPLITNVDAQPTTQASDFRNKLADQISSSVRWSQTLRRMHEDGMETFVEIGPGKVLTGMMKRIYKTATLFNVYDRPSLEQTVDALKEKVCLS